MRRSLQNKFNLLGAILVVFFLLMIPMFTQVKADTQDSLQDARNTLLAQWARQLRTDFKPPDDLENTEVEDYWEEQARKEDPNCGDECDPEGDRDGDGMSNRDELRTDRNPSCNEEKMGAAYCEGRDKHNLTKPDDVIDRLPVVLLANFTWRVPSGECSQGVGPFGGSCAAREIVLNESFRRVEIYLNVTGFQGFSWNFNVVHQETGSQGITWTGQRSYNGLAPASPTYPRPTAVGIVEKPEPGNLRATLSGSMSNGAWEVLAYGVR